MKKSVVIAFGVLIVFMACRQHPLQQHAQAPGKTDTLVYSYKNVKERASDCGNKPDSACSVAKITYPVFDSQNQLNDVIVDSLAFAIDGKPADGLEQQAKNFIQAYMQDSLRTNNPDMLYTLESSASVLRQDQGLVTIQFDRYMYAGGAHGSSHTAFLNWDSKTGKEMGLGDILSQGYETKLTAVAEKTFRDQEKLSATAALKDYFFKDAKFALNNNFLVTPVGIRFLYNEYEIKPYSDGTTELLIPYTQIKSLLRPNTVVSQYVK